MASVILSSASRGLTKGTNVECITAGVLNLWPVTSNQGSACLCTGMADQQAKTAINGVLTRHPTASEGIELAPAAEEAGTT